MEGHRKKAKYLLDEDELGRYYYIDPQIVNFKRHACRDNEEPKADQDTRINSKY